MPTTSPPKVPFEVLPGSKSYITAAAAALYGIAGAVLGAHDYGHAVELVIFAASIVAMRMGVEKAVL